MTKYHNIMMLPHGHDVMILRHNFMLGCIDCVSRCDIWTTEKRDARHRCCSALQCVATCFSVLQCVVLYWIIPNFMLGCIDCVSRCDFWRTEKRIVHKNTAHKEGWKSLIRWGQRRSCDKLIVFRDVDCICIYSVSKLQKKNIKCTMSAVERAYSIC